MLEKIDWAMDNLETLATLGNGQSRDTGNIGHNTQNKDKQKPQHRKLKRCTTLLTPPKNWV